MENVEDSLAQTRERERERDGWLRSSWKIAAASIAGVVLRCLNNGRVFVDSGGRFEISEDFVRFRRIEKHRYANNLKQRILNLLEGSLGVVDDDQM